jgi:hypothetical protein
LTTAASLMLPGDQNPSRAATRSWQWRRSDAAMQRAGHTSSRAHRKAGITGWRARPPTDS